MASLTSVAQSAIYRVALYLLTIQGVVDTTFYAVVGTYISRNYHHQNKEDYQAFIRKMNAVQLSVTFVVFLVLFCAAGPILGIYGPTSLPAPSACRSWLPPGCYVARLALKRCYSILLAVNAP